MAKQAGYVSSWQVIANLEQEDKHHHIITRNNAQQTDTVRTQGSTQESEWQPKVNKDWCV